MHRELVPASSTLQEPIQLEPRREINFTAENIETPNGRPSSVTVAAHSIPDWSLNLYLSDSECTTSYSIHFRYLYIGWNRRRPSSDIVPVFCRIVSSKINLCLCYIVPISFIILPIKLIDPFLFRLKKKKIMAQNKCKRSVSLNFLNCCNDYHTYFIAWLDEGSHTASAYDQLARVQEIEGIDRPDFKLSIRGIRWNALILCHAVKRLLMQIFFMSLSDINPAEIGTRYDRTHR